MASHFFGYEGSSNPSLIKMYAIRGDYLVHLKTGRKFELSILRIFGNSMSLMDQMVNAYGAKQTGEGIVVTPKVLGHVAEIEMASPESLRTVIEIYGKHQYFFDIGKPTVVIDIGGNIGIASLFFAALPWVEKVLAYEIIRTTHELAVRNSQRNEYALGKVQCFNQGVWIENRSSKIKFAGFGDVSSGVHLVNESEGEPVELIDAARLIESCYQGNPDKAIVVKMDCEGAEYEIIEALFNSGSLGLISALIIEWHELGPETIIAKLKQAGFVICTNRIDSSNQCGLIYAFGLQKRFDILT